MNNTRRAAIIEDDLSHQDSVTTYLSTLGHQTQTFSSEKECLQHASEKPNLIVLNHDFKEESNGIEVPRKTKTAFEHAPVVYSHQNLSGIAETYRRNSKYSVEKNNENMVKIKIGHENISKSNPYM